MLKRFLLICQLSLYLFACDTSTNNQNQHSEIENNKPIQRIVSLAPHITENLYYLGLEDKLVATVAYSDYPEAAKKIPRIGDAFSINLEKLISAQPDLIIAWKDSLAPDLKTQIEKLDIPLLISNPVTIAAIENELISIKELTHSEKDINFSKQFEELAKQYQHSRNISVFYPVWHEPLMTIGGPQILNEIFAVCGAKNIYHDININSFQVDVEDLLQRKPKLIIHGKATQQPLALDKIPALILENDALARPNANILQGAVELCAKIDSFRQNIL